MKAKIIFLLLSTSLVSQLLAQQPEDAIRSSWFTQNGTARMVAIGGAMGSLGGDISANHVNPAGLGLFKTRELVLTPGFGMNNNRFAYRGTDTASKRNAFEYGTMGVVWGTARNKNYSRYNSSAFAISVTQLANYQNRESFRGFNNVSSFTEQYLEELVRDRADTNAALSNYIFGSSLAFRTFLVDTTQGAGGTVSGYQSLVPISTGVNQLYDAITRGSYNEIAIGTAGNVEDRLYLGASITLPIIRFSRELFYGERDATNNPNNQFKFFEYKELFSSNGFGFGAKLGMIYKPADMWRVGFAFHTPQIIGFKDEIRSSITADTEGYAGLRTETSDRLNSGNAGERQYTFTTPWRAILSLSHVFREISDTRQQRAFISADLEYVNYRSARFHGGEFISQQLDDYYRYLNETIRDIYRGNINARVGAELKLNTFMLRAGAAYYGSPYNNDFNANRLVTSGGIGYRNKGMFIDLTYAHTFNRDVRFPYLLSDKANTFAEQTGSIGRAMVTVGFKF
ncbi:MAG: OmpP1/FadL family transporter [Bacteroidota bacterium]